MQERRLEVFFLDKQQKPWYKCFNNAISVPTINLHYYELIKK
ncbi:hypothetical protein KL86DYS2_10028 [uncultured Dysgonomonas sp.]|uniref:Uncharacterized protein n=1 Tax=uncultured Dysgonomonas sp. TaxID=206096 RepID=A0A212IUJ5_9BACT|nr:hypothetical protein KL86DYS2_10028 [uncultured Dysgonomonas sp.]